MDSNFAISLRGLTKYYPNSSRPALDAVDLDIQKGKFFGLLGPNGAGKSTIINILAGLALKTSGKVLISGLDLDEHHRDTKWNIGIVPQELVIDPFFTVHETLEFYAGYYGIPKRKRITDELISAMGLEAKANAPSRSLSGGMRRRLLIAKALVHKPPVIVLDEPTAGVDIELRLQLWDYIRKLNKAGTTIILTTHYLEEAEQLCDEIAIINRGKLVTQGSTSDLLQQAGKKTYRFQLGQPLELIPNELARFPLVLKTPTELELNCSNIEMLSQLLPELQENGIEVTDLTIHQAKLEEVFRSYVTV